MSKHSMMKGLACLFMTMAGLFLFSGIGYAQSGGGNLRYRN